jgi:Mn2+/Fe2+ NRAMP family transporter
VVALIGTTVAPWQLFFQQSNVVDKRITARWLHYERIDTMIGAVIVLAGAGAVMFAASTLHGSGTRQLRARRHRDRLTGRDPRRGGVDDRRLVRAW